MHELPVTESLLEITLRHAAQSGAKRVTDVYLVIGDLASVIDDSVQFYWDIVSKGSLAEGATLHFERIHPTWHCLDCNRDFQAVNGDFSCAVCREHQVRAISGDEFRLAAIDIDE